MTARTVRIDQLLREEIGRALAEDLSDPAIGFATVTEVETSPDLSHARVLVSVIGQKAERSATLAALQRAMPRIRHDLGRTLHLRRIPEFHVRLDDSMERGTRILHILDELEHGHEPVDPGVAESLPTPVRRIHQEGDADEPPQVDAAAPEPSRPQRRRLSPKQGTPRGRPTSATRTRRRTP